MKTAKKTPKISVIMTVYNGEPYLSSAIESILSQTLIDFELIIIDDNSDDESLRIMRGYQKHDRRIKIITNRKNLGPAGSRNKGLQIAKGKYIAIQDSDDISLPERFKKEHDFLEEHPDIFLVASNVTLLYEGERTDIKQQAMPPEENRKHLIKYNHIFHSSIMFRNGENMRYREKFKYAQDYDLLLNVLSRGLNIHYISEILLNYRINKKGITASKTELQNLFAVKAKEFYHQRIKYGKDEYLAFNPHEELERRIKTRPPRDRGDGTKGIRIFIDYAVYTDRRKALRLLYKNRKDLDCRYVLNKLLLMMLPKGLLLWRRRNNGQ